uniref:Uncharacterized protein n=1 Tax=Schistosoma curassoni TaxID=6186 RepID=A0A183JRD5_9TREM
MVLSSTTQYCQNTGRIKHNRFHLVKLFRFITDQFEFSMTLRVRFKKYDIQSTTFSTLSRCD